MSTTKFGNFEHRGNNARKLKVKCDQIESIFYRK